jgi:HPt (histidine-containing phosphotransfer) domain-containing protein
MPAGLRTAADAADFDTMSRLAHKLKGTCGDICAHALREQAAATDLAARASAPDAASRVRDLADTLDAFLRELQAAASCRDRRCTSANPQRRASAISNCSRRPGCPMGRPLQ